MTRSPLDNLCRSGRYHRKKIFDRVLYRILIPLILLVSVAGSLTCCGAKGAKPGEGISPVVISSIAPSETNDKTEIAIEGSSPILQYTSFQLTEPLRLVIDISDAELGKFQDRLTVNMGAVTDITPNQQDNIARLEIALTHQVDTKVYQAGGKLIVELGKPPVQEARKPAEPVSSPTGTQPPVEEKAPAAQKPEAPQVEVATATIVTAVKAAAGRDGVKVVISANGSMKPSTFMVEGKKLVIDIPGTKSRVRPNVIPVRKGGISKVRVGQHEDKVRVVLDLTRQMGYEAKSEGNTVIIAMTSAAVAKAAVKPEEKTIERAAPEEKAPEAEKETAPVPSMPAERAPARAAPFDLPAAPSEEQTVIGGSRYTGRKISLDLQDADLVNVLRLFADVSNMNMIISPDVKGKVTVRLINIPWDQAMDIILKMNGLGMAHEDNIVRIATLGALARESEEELKAKEAKKKAEDLITRIIPINYATAGAIEGTIKKSLSARGETVVDSRTNTLIVKDIARNVDEVVTLIKLLDKPIPQVMIEARIVEATTTFTRDIGVQWGGQYNASPTYGNSTGLIFPNTVGVTGGSIMGGTASGTGNYFVNMPAGAGAGAGGAVGFVFGSLNKALNLDLVLSAMESTGEGKVVSTPRISALDNKEAKIEQGQSIPYSSTSASGTQVQFIDAQLSLSVTPHVTPDNKVFMKIQAQKNAADTSLLGAGGQPSIRKNQATTEILLGDGETAVIGGILIIDKGQTIQKVPFFADIPIIGWFFKKKTVKDDKRELIIFITPRIVRQEVI